VCFFCTVKVAHYSKYNISTKQSKHKWSINGVLTKAISENISVHTLFCTVKVAHCSKYTIITKQSKHKNTNVSFVRKGLIEWCQVISDFYNADIHKYVTYIVWCLYSPNAGYCKNKIIVKFGNFSSFQISHENSDCQNGG